MVCIINEVIHFMRFIISDWNYNQQYTWVSSNIYNLLEPILISCWFPVTVTPLSLYWLPVYADVGYNRASNSIWSIIALKYVLRYTVMSDYLHTIRFYQKSEKNFFVLWGFLFVCFIVWCFLYFQLFVFVCLFYWLPSLTNCIPFT